MKLYIDKLDLHINVEPSHTLALASMCYLRTPKTKIPNKVKFEDIVQNKSKTSKVGVVVDIQGVYASVQYVECQNGKWSDTGDHEIVRADNLELLDENQITDTQELGCASLYKSMGRQTVDYPKANKTDNKRWW